jgi:hypothetical protein
VRFRESKRFLVDARCLKSARFIGSESSIDVVEFEADSSLVLQ